MQLRISNKFAKKKPALVIRAGFFIYLYVSAHPSNHGAGNCCGNNHRADNKHIINSKVNCLSYVTFTLLRTNKSMKSLFIYSIKYTN